jgi:hypothetical protein
MKTKIYEAVLLSLCFFHYIIAAFFLSFGNKKYSKIAEIGLFISLINVFLLPTIAYYYFGNTASFGLIYYVIPILAFTWIYYNKFINNFIPIKVS